MWLFILQFLIFAFLRIRTAMVNDLSKEIKKNLIVPLDLGTKQGAALFLSGYGG
jgi:hypothetical protein